MGEWRKRDQSGSWWPATTTTTKKHGNYGRPPLSPGSQQHSFPHWEKKFCTSVCFVPWRKLLETKKLMYMYPKIVDWNDSAGEEAFKNAKARYWAHFNHLPCPLPLPDPNLYIDVVDYDAVIDPELVEDLYEQPPPPQSGEEDHVPGIFEIKPTGWGDEEDDQITSNQWMRIKPSGWGDEEDDQIASNQMMQIKPSGWGDEEEDQIASSQLMHIKPNGWGDEEEDQIPTVYPFKQSIQIQPTGWGDTYNDPYYCENPETMTNGGDSWEHQTYRNDGYRRRRGGSGRSRFGSNYSNGGRYRGRKRGNYHTDENKSGWKSMSSCGPVNQRGSTLQWQKSVS